MDYTKLSVEELQKLKKEWYKTAEEDGSINKCYLVGRILGEDVRHTYGPKYQWDYQGVKIYIDDYGNYMTVDYCDTRVCFTASGKLFVPGDWMNIVSEAAIKAEEVKQEREEIYKEEKRQHMLKELGLV
jgi:hypothetical protein